MPAMPYPPPVGASVAPRAGSAAEHSQRDTVGVAEGRLDGSVGSVLADVGQSLARDPLQREADVGVELARLSHDLQARFAAGLLAICADEAFERLGQRAAVLAQGGNGLARLVEAVDRKLTRALDALRGTVDVGALHEQGLGDLELDGECGQGVRQHVVHLACNAHALVERGGARLLLARPLRLCEQQLRLLGAQDVLLAG